MEENNLYEQTQVKKKGGNRMLAFSILISAAIIVGSVIYSVGKNNPGSQEQFQSRATAQLAPPVWGAGSVENIKPVSGDDHILGNPEAPVKVVTFFDTECPFCKRFHPTMQQLIQEYGGAGRVAWVYRHFPLDQLHPVKARKEAEATECANELGGNAKFWEYTDRLYEITPSNNNLDPNELSRIADHVGLDRVQFEQCLNSGKYAPHIQEDLDDAIRSGGTGTPYNVVIAGSGKKFVISGAQPYSAVKSIIEIALQER